VCIDQAYHLDLAATEPVITPATRNVKEAFCYVDAKRSIIRTANKQFPINDGVKLYGVLYMKIVIRSDGTIDDVSVVRSSGQNQLDAAAKRIVASAAPFKGCSVMNETVVAPAWEIDCKYPGIPVFR
ncbi:MAG: TonB family protein, partial [Pseudomonadota bacterium]|nr:TonB family protein [Pseudomonadota bacterium]